MILKTVFNIRAGIIIIQKLFLVTKIFFITNLTIIGYKKEQKYIKVIIALRKELVNKIVINFRMNFVNYPYLIILKIQKLTI